MTRLPEQQGFDARAPRVLIVGANCKESASSSLWFKPMMVPTLEAASKVLRMRDFDVILNPISVGNNDGVALPSLLLELGQQGVLSQLPHILWCSDLAPGVLDSHVQLARDAGVSAQVVPSLSSATAQEVLKVLAKGKLSTLSPLSNTLQGVLDDQDLLNALLAVRDLRIVVQPQVDLRSGKYVGAEALARWRHPVLGDIPPSIFVPMANKAELNVLLFHLVEAKVVALLSELKKRNIALPISVNASADTLCTPGLIERLERRLQRAGVPNTLLKIELTEDVPVSNILSLSTVLAGLRMRGFSVAADDFGCGASTLDMLTKLPFSELKIDGRFVRGMGSTPGCAAAVSGAISIANEMSLEFIAEGIETSEHVDALLGKGCKVGQGFGLCPPLEVEDFVWALTSNMEDNCLGIEKS